MTLTFTPPPQTPIEPVTEILHGFKVTDPYRWLEDQTSPETRAWIDRQSAYTRAYFAAIPIREEIHQRVSELQFIPAVTEPWSVGNRYFFLRRQENKEQASIVMKDGLFGQETTLVDPTLRATGASTNIAIVAISQDGRLLAYSVRQGGTDHSSIEILDTERNTVLPSCLKEGFCTAFVFARDNSGFYYSHRALRAARPNYCAVFWHAFGTEQSEDQEIFFGAESPNLFVRILLSPDTGLLAYSVCHPGEQRRNSLSVHEAGCGTRPRLLLDDIEGYFVPFFVHGQLLAFTDVGAPNFRVVRIDIDAPRPENWCDVVAESDRRIQQFAVAGDQIFVTRIDRFFTTIETFQIDGRLGGQTLFAAHGTVNLLNRTTSTDKLFYSHTSMSHPSSIYCYDTSKDELIIWNEAQSLFDTSMIAVEEVSYISKDGTSVPLLLAARKDLLHSGSLPTFLTGYGGFGHCVTPRFTAFGTFLIEQGFLFAVPALRGGSELGEQWHRHGKRDKRQNAFDDFIAAAEWLVAQERSVPGRFAVGGGSNAGLLIGAVITQRPDLFRAGICLGPLLDMTRYHLFDFATGWADEYGSPDDEQAFHFLFAYSPYHRVQKNVAYPAMLVISGDSDTRCNPMHARKMVARLQAATSSGHPILLDYDAAWGHIPVQPQSRKIDSLTNRLSFVFHELGIEIQRRGSH